MYAPAGSSLSIERCAAGLHCRGNEVLAAGNAWPLSVEQIANRPFRSGRGRSRLGCERKAIQLETGSERRPAEIGSS
jgi:hypothetical protein